MKTTTIRGEPAVTRAQATANAWLAELAASDKARASTDTKAGVLGLVLLAALVAAVVFGWQYMVATAIGMACILFAIATAICALGPVVLLLGFILYFIIRIANK